MFAAGLAPVGLPRRGDMRARVRSLDLTPFLDAYSHRGRARAPWPRGRVERELREFTHGRSLWPSASAFQDAGRARLFAQVRLQGGEPWWAQRLGLGLRDRDARRTAWTEGRVRASLAIYLADKQNWPTVAEFHADDMGALRAAV